MVDWKLVCHLKFGARVIPFDLNYPPPPPRTDVTEVHIHTFKESDSFVSSI